MTRNARVRATTRADPARPTSPVLPPQLTVLDPIPSDDRLPA
jgi:hypothetical protein